jgi:hypothetical protein
MLLYEFQEKRGRENKGIIVSKETFLNEVSRKTGLQLEELEKTDLGQIEQRLKIKAEKPNDSLSLKRGKSKAELYTFIGMALKRSEREEVTNLLAH